ncbi:hypothetical protein F383_15171 [Gossypium arboreum]|uniref:Uncharacterized protein n=1 Tax=Gossypium arboreum TaxID=29729 RepID=A0A0B0NC37_GOSAR|nr:hypothetical protein F383_15171 [Gossypium arboreum]
MDLTGFCYCICSN